MAKSQTDEQIIASIEAEVNKKSIKKAGKEVLTSSEKLNDQLTAISKKHDLRESIRKKASLSKSERQRREYGRKRTLDMQKRYDREANQLSKAQAKSLNKTKSWSQKMTASTERITLALGAMAAAMLLNKLKQYGAELFNIAVKAQGIERAFARLNRPQLLANLVSATKGTVTQLELMTAAVQAKNLGVPLAELATYFEFAHRRARETGESVQQLTQDIVTGIGRKSVLILDNLGLSAVRINKEFKKTGDFGAAAGNIIKQELGNMGNYAENAADKIGLINANLENMKKKIGDVFIGVFNQLAKSADLNSMNEGMDSFANTVKNMPWQEMTSFFVILSKVTAFAYKPLADLTKANIEIAASFHKAAAAMFAPLDWSTLIPAKKVVSTEIEKSFGAWLTLMEKEIKLVKEKAIKLDSLSKVTSDFIEKINEKIKLDKLSRDKAWKELFILQNMQKSYRGNASAIRLLNSEIEKRNKLLRISGSPTSVNVPDKMSTISTKIKTPAAQTISSGVSLPSTGSANSYLAMLRNIGTAVNAFSMQWGGLFNQLGQNVMSILDSTVSSLQNQLEIINQIVVANELRWKNESDALINAGQQNSVYYRNLERRHKDTQSRMAKKQQALQSQVWEADKDASITKVLFNTAQAVMAAWASGPIIGSIMTGLILALSGTQIGAITGQSNPYKRQFGGWVPGNGFNDNVPVDATSGEFVVRKEIARDNARFLENLNAGNNVERQGTVVNLIIQGNVYDSERFIKEQAIPLLNEAANEGYNMEFAQR